MPDDPDELLAWMEGGASGYKGETAVETLEPEKSKPPTPSYEIAELQEDVTVETSEGVVKWASSDSDDFELDLDFDMPDDPDEMLIWMEGLSEDGNGGTDPKVSAPTATKSGEELSALIEEPARTSNADATTPLSIHVEQNIHDNNNDGGDNDEFATPLDVVTDKKEFDDFPMFDTSPIDDILGTEDEKVDKNDTSQSGKDISLGKDFSDSMPEWLSFTGDNEETDWLSALPEADVSGWLEAEGSDSVDADWSKIGSTRIRSHDNKITKGRSRTQQTVHTEELHLPETSMLSSFNLDGEKLRDARHLVNSGDTDSSLIAYRSLIKKGDGLNVIIADLEVAIQKFKGEPQMSHLLGDAYTQNGQLQKAVDTYRGALRMM